MNIVGKRKIFFTIPAILIVIGIVSMIAMGFNLDIDFSGGTEITIDMVDAEGKAIEFTNEDVESFVAESSGHAVSTTQKVDATQVMLRFTDYFTDKEAAAVKTAIAEKYGVDQGAISVSSVSATIGKELVGQSILLCIITVILMLAYITIRFEFRFGVCSVVALVHDVLIMLSFYALFQIPVNTSFIAAILTIIGYSINATIVVFDRIRESMRLANRKTDVEAVVNGSILSTVMRSINTSITTLLTVVLLQVMVDSIRDFTLPIIVGVLAGAYSSIFVAGPLWSLWKTGGKKKEAAK